MDDLRLGPSFHILVFVHDPHSSLHVLFPHKTFVKRQVMAYSVLLILSSSVYVSAKSIFSQCNIENTRVHLTVHG